MKKISMWAMSTVVLVGVTVAHSSARSTATNLPPVVVITDPTDPHTTGVNFQWVYVTATDDKKVVSLTWTNSSGGSGAFTLNGTSGSALVDLWFGSNVITATATDAEGLTGTDTVTITCTAQPSSIGVNGCSGPSIDKNGENNYSTTDLAATGFNGSSHIRHYVTDPSYEEGAMGPGWNDSVPKLMNRGSNRFVFVNGSSPSRSWTRSGNIFTPDLFYKDTLTERGTVLDLFDEAGNPTVFYNTTYGSVPLAGRLYLVPSIIFRSRSNHVQQRA